MEVKIIFQNLRFLLIQCNRVENYLFRNTSFSVLEYSIVEILNFKSLITEKCVTPVFSLLQYYFCKLNGNFLLVITFLFIDGMISNFGNNSWRQVSEMPSF